MEKKNDEINKKQEERMDMDESDNQLHDEAVGGNADEDNANGDKVIDEVSEEVNEIKEPEKRKHKCQYDKCNKAYKRKFNLQQHVSAKHLNKKLTCPHESCGKEYTSQSGLTKHTRIKHSCDCYVCATCQRAFISHRRYSIHKSECDPDDPVTPPSSSPSPSPPKKNKKQPPRSPPGGGAAGAAGSVRDEFRQYWMNFQGASKRA